MQAVLTLVPEQKPKPALRNADAVVELTDGSIIRGRQYLAHGSRARITLADGPMVEVPVAAVRTVQLQQKLRYARRRMVAVEQVEGR